MRTLGSALFVTLLSALCSSAFGFSIDSRGVHQYFERNTRAHSKVPFLDSSEPIHEILTDKALQCGVAGALCERLSKIGITRSYIHEGLRSSDFPAAYFTEDTFVTCRNRLLRITNDSDVACILASYGNAASSKHLFNNRNWTMRRSLGVRGHFGDLQFMHSMAPEGQSAEESYKHIRMWMEFAYRVSRHEFDLKSDVSQVSVSGMKTFFVRGARKVGDLFDYRFTYPRAGAVALGQMLHIAQDSFARCHTRRDLNGQIIQFLSYLHQDTSSHRAHDNDMVYVESLERLPLNPISFAKELLEMRAADKSWEEVQSLIERYFKPAPNSPSAARGQGC